MALPKGFVLPSIIIIPPFHKEWGHCEPLHSWGMALA